MSGIKQFKTYVKKFFKLFISEKGWISLLFCVVISTLLAYVTKDDMFVYRFETESGCFALVSACIWIGIFNSIQSVCKERKIIQHEYYSGLKLSSYILARAFFEMILCFTQAILMLLICYFTMDFPEAGFVTQEFYLDMFIVFFVLLTVSDFLGIMVSSICKTTTVAMTVVPFLLILQLVFSGVLFEIDGDIGRLADITISKWGMEILGTISNINGLPYTSGLIYEEEVYARELAHVYNAFGMLAVFAIIYVIIAIIMLRLVKKDTR